MTATSEAAPGKGRVARKREAARARIIESARDLFRERGVDDVTIQDITSAADVGHGSFYLHFSSKHEVLLPIMVAEAAKLDARIQRHLGPDADPAAVLATSSRYIGSVVIRDDLWRWFLRNSGLPVEALRQAFGEFSGRDFQRGVATGRFTAPDLSTAAKFAFGGFVSVLMAAIDLTDPGDMIDRAVESMLIVLGIHRSEATSIVGLPLPVRS
jgi:AcrR family transcriptional regulator